MRLWLALRRYDVVIGGGEVLPYVLLFVHKLESAEVLTDHRGLQVHVETTFQFLAFFSNIGFFRVCSNRYRRCSGRYRYLNMM